MAIGVIYVLFFFLLYGLLFVLPELLDILERVPPGPEQEALAKRAAREALGSNVYTALAAAIVTVALGAYYRVLPGMTPAE
jgi:ABC-type sulfate transport system permease component